MSPLVTTSSNLSDGGAYRLPRQSSSLAQLLAPQKDTISAPPTTTSTSVANSNTTSVTTTRNTSIQSSPEGPRGRNLPSQLSPPPLALSEPPMNSNISRSPSVKTDPTTLNRGPGLIRRISRGAANRLTRRRQSSNHASNRDSSSGPVIVRRRSDSKGVADLDGGYADVGIDGDDDDLSEESSPVFGLGLSSDGCALGSGTTSPNSLRPQGGIAPIVPSLLRRGTNLTKVTKRKKKSLTFVLDTNSAKVMWDPANSSKRFYIDDVQQIRLQKDAKNYREEFQVSADLESRWFTIIYADQDRAKGRPVKTMHLIAPNQYIFELWTTTLEELSRYRHELMAGLAGSGQDEKTLRGHWRRTMAQLYGDTVAAEHSQTLDFSAIESLCRSLHINCSKNTLRAQFDKADVDATKSLTFEEFKDFVRRLKERQDIKEIFKGLVGDTTESLDLDHFLHFLQHSQGVNVDANRTHWTKIFTKFVRQSCPKLPTTFDLSEDTSLHMGLQAFTSFLTSTCNNVQVKRLQEAKFDRPLNEYFISSSHNTYLLGRQIAGNSSTEPYIRALQKACRCVEIDCWDGADGRPIVSHGRTMTSSIPFADCISVIAKYAFEVSHYPLIMSLEVHCNPEQQQAMVDIMIKEMGDRLIRGPLSSDTSVLPSPQDLRDRILVKVKFGEDSNDRDPSTENAITSQTGRRQRSTSSPWSRPQMLDNTSIPNSPLLPSLPSAGPQEQTSSTSNGGRRSITAPSLSSATEDSDTAQAGLDLARRPAKKAKSKIIKSLGDLGVYSKGLKFNDLDLPDSKTYNHVFSISERNFEALCKDPRVKADVEKHNMQYLMRIYPSPLRVKSTNPDPLAFWRRGVQMVALNWQTYDLGMQINEAMFACGSDQHGYVLKPPELRQPAQKPLSECETILSRRNKIQKKVLNFSLEMVSAQQIPRPRGAAPDDTLDPYIEIEMFSAEDKAKGIVTGEGGQNASARNGMSGIGSPHRRRTKVVQNNGYNPIFNSMFRLSLETKYPSLVFVRWSVWNSQDGRNYNNNNSEPLATFTAKLSSLEQGYRHLPLFDHNGDQFLFATLFCKITKHDPITIERDDPVTEKVGRLKSFGQAVFKRTVSMDGKKAKDEDKGMKRRPSAAEM